MVNDKIVFDFMKKNYSIPAVEICKVNVAYGICEAGSFTQTTGYPIEGNPNEGI